MSVQVDVSNDICIFFLTQKYENSLYIHKAKNISILENLLFVKYILLFACRKSCPFGWNICLGALRLGCFVTTMIFGTPTGWLRTVPLRRNSFEALIMVPEEIYAGTCYWHIETWGLWFYWLVQWRRSLKISFRIFRRPSLANALTYCRADSPGVFSWIRTWSLKWYFSLLISYHCSPCRQSINFDFFSVEH